LGERRWAKGDGRWAMGEGRKAFARGRREIEIELGRARTMAAHGL